MSRAGARQLLERPAAAATTTARPTSTYKPHLDGLRAVAVYLVVLFHAGIVRFSGGFIGVDVFFVLSGFLITGLLVREQDATGRIDLRTFYARRFRRLLPAALVVLITTTLVYAATASPADVAREVPAIKSAVLYVANWHFIGRSTDYFAQDVTTSPVIHFWSLAVEEQFYLVWPLVFGGVTLLASRVRRSQEARRLVIGLLALASLALALLIARTDPDRAYFGTDTRAYQLLLGASLALVPSLGARLGRVRAVPVLGAAAWAGLAVIATSSLAIGPVQRGVLAAGATAVIIATMEASSGRDPIKRVLSHPTLAHLGRISYGTYLWHWLIMLVAKRGFDTSPKPIFVISALLATGLAALSHEVLERPVRTSPLLDRSRTTVIMGSLALSALVGLVLVPRLADSGPATEVTVAQGTAETGTEVPEDLDWRSALADTAAFPTCGAQDLAGCTVTDGTGRHVLLLGDSHGRMLLPALEAVAERQDLRLSVAVRPSCPWVPGVTYRGEGAQCFPAQRDWYGPVLEALDPDLVVLVHRGIDDGNAPTGLETLDGRSFDKGAPAIAGVVEERAAEGVRQLLASGADVLIVEPVPVTSEEADPLTCLSEATYLDECRFVAAPVSPIERAYRRIAAEDPEHVRTLDMDAWACPYLPICDPLVDRLIVRRDHTHLTTRFTRSLAPRFERLLEDAGLLG